LRSQANEEVLKMFEDIRLKKSNTFAFIEVFDNETFEKNYLIVRDVVDLLSKFQFRNNEKSSCLGDFFENLLNTSLKEEFGQFFTPYPLVDFMISSLPLREKIEENIRNNRKDILPFFIDYACGSGYFLISYINKLQEEIDSLKRDISNSSYPKELKERLASLKNFE
jgi:type I restriction enzyme M protein